MAYALHIEPLDLDESDGLALDAWKEAIRQTTGVRLASGELTARNPNSGETIIVPFREGDAEVLLTGGRWAPAFSWSNGSASFCPARPGDSSDPLWVAAVAITRRLEAAIRGDEGEEYDLETGNVT